MNVLWGDASIFQDPESDLSFLFINSLWSEAIIPGEPIDPWANIKIPFLEPEAIDWGEHWYWFKDGQERSYSALVGVPVLELPAGNSTFSLETTYVDFECEALEQRSFKGDPTTFLTGEAVSRTALNIFDAGSEEYPRIPNGSWYGSSINYSEFEQVIYHESIHLALDRFIDPLWLEIRDDMDMVPQSLAYFENKTQIEAGQTNLLFESRAKYYLEHDVNYTTSLLTTHCLVLQKYVESRASCSVSRHQSRPDCIVEAQRPSQKPHPPENLSLLSNPILFKIVSGLFSDIEKESQWSAIEDYLAYIYYIGNVSRSDPKINTFPAKNFSQALSQVINSYFIAYQAGEYRELSQFAATPEQVAGLSRITNATTRGSRHIYSISWPWFGASVASCLVLSVASIAGVCLVYLSKGPEILGYVSAIVQNSGIIGLPSQAGQMDGDKLAKAMRKRRFRYGYRDSKNGGNAIGIGPEEDVSKF